MTYDDVRGRAAQIAAVTARRIMPPWKPEPGKGDFTDVRRLTDEELGKLQRWIAAPTPMEQFRSEVAVKLRAASYGDRAAVLAQVAEHRAEHASRLAHYERLAADLPPSATDHDLDVRLVLRGGIRLEQFWVDWLTEYLDAHSGGTA